MEVISGGLMIVCLMLASVDAVAQEAESTMKNYDYWLEVAGASLGVDCLMVG